MDDATLHARIRMVELLKIAIEEANKLNDIVNNMHNTLEANAARKANEAMARMVEALKIAAEEANRLDYAVNAARKSAIGLVSTLCHRYD